MNPPAPRPPRRPYWLLLGLAALLLAPTVVATGALIAMGLAAATMTAARMRARRRPAAAEAGAVTIGVDRDGRPISISDHELAAHCLILGASGSGKTTTLLTILEDQIDRGRPVVAIDLKGSPAFVQQLREAAAAAGRPFRVWTLDGDDHWNPLAHGNPTELKDKLIATERFTEPHYQRAAERYVQTVLQVLVQARPDRPPTLDDVLSLMEPARLSGMLRHVEPRRAGQIRDYLSTLGPDQLSAIRGLGTRLAIITESHTGRYLTPEPDAGRAPIDLRRALEGDEVVVFSLNSSSYGKLASQIGNLVVQDLITAAGDRLTKGIGTPGTIGIDEAATLGSDGPLQLFARCREAGVSLLMATQEMADLERAARGFRDQVLGNTAVKIIHRQETPLSARTSAELSGTHQVWEETHQIGGVFSRGGRGTRRLADQFIVHPNEIKSLPTGRMVLISKLPRASARIVQVRRPGGHRGAEGRGGPERGLGGRRGAEGRGGPKRGPER